MTAVTLKPVNDNRFTETPDPDNLAAALCQLLPGDVVLRVQPIIDAEQDSLSEHFDLAAMSKTRRREFVAGRIAARHCLEELGVEPAWLAADLQRVPQWPASVVGSLAHDRRFAVAAATGANHLAGLGIDFEPVSPLEPDVVQQIALAAESDAWSRSDALTEWPLALFCLKEALFKAVFPLQRIYFDFPEVSIAPSDDVLTATYCGDRDELQSTISAARGRFCVADGYVVAAFWISAHESATSHHL